MCGAWWKIHSYKSPGQAESNVPLSYVDWTTWLLNLHLDIGCFKCRSAAKPSWLKSSVVWLQCNLVSGVKFNSVDLNSCCWNEINHFSQTFLITYDRSAVLQLHGMWNEVMLLPCSTAKLARVHFSETRN